MKITERLNRAECDGYREGDAVCRDLPPHDPPLTPRDRSEILREHERWAWTEILKARMAVARGEAKWRRIHERIVELGVSGVDPRLPEVPKESC